MVELKTHKFVDALRGHEGTVLSMAFSRDAKKVVTACEDGKLRVFSVGDWKLLQTLTGHHGPVHRAEFSPNGKWIASAGEDQTVRVWSADDGTLLQTLQESQEPLLDVAFSPDSRFIAASSEERGSHLATAGGRLKSSGYGARDRVFKIWNSGDPLICEAPRKNGADK